MGHVYRTYNAYCEGKAGSTPLERLREKRGGQAPRSYPFGSVGFLKPIHPSKWPGQRLVLCHFLGMRYVTGGGCLGYPFAVDAEGYREVIKGHSFKLKEPLQYDVESLFPLLAGVRPQDFPEPRLEAPEAEKALPPPDFPPELDPPVLPREEVSPQPIADGADGMDVDAGEVGEGPEPMTIDKVDEVSEGEGSEEEEGDAWLNNLILQTQSDVWNTFCLRESGCVFPVGEGNGDFFVEEFGGQKVRVDIPERSFDKLTGAALDFEQVKQGMKTEVQQLERLKVGRCLVEREGRALAKEKQVTVLTSRWVLTQKTPEIARCRLVVRDFATGGASALNSGIYAPTSSLDGLRCVLAVSVVKDLSLLTADVSVAFMHAPVEAEACDLVLLPANISINGCRVIAWLGKAMNGLRRAPLLWFLELQRVVYSMGGQDTFDNTLFRLQTPNGLLLVLVYVDDLLVAAESPAEGEAFFFFSSSLAVNALWHGPDRYISGEKSDTQHDWPVSKNVGISSKHKQNESPKHDDPQIPQPDLRFVPTQAKQQENGAGPNKTKHPHLMPFCTVAFSHCIQSKNMQTERINSHKTYTTANAS